MTNPMVDVGDAVSTGRAVMVTRGALLRCRSEDELAGILAHELAHVSFKHGEGVIRASPGWQSSIGTLFKVVGAAANANDQSVAPNMTQLLSDTARDLALQRGLAVRDALIAKGLPSDRLFLGAPKLRASGEDDAAWTPRVQLTLAGA